MPNTKAPQILIAAGNYDIVNSTVKALQAYSLAIQRTYTHRDTLYSLAQTRFDVILVDAGMFDRYTGDVTLPIIAQTQNDMVLVAFDLRDEKSEITTRLTDNVIHSLDSQEISRVVQRALRLMPVTDVLSSEKVETDEALSQRVDELRTLFSLSQSLTEVLDLTEVLNRVVEAARRLTDADEGMILLPGDEAGQLYLRAKVGIDVEVARNFRIKTQDSLAGHVFFTGEPALIGDQGPLRVKTEYFVNSLLYVPILLKGTPIGVLGVNNKTKEDEFNLNHQELLMNLASYTAIAIENARIHEESLQRARDLEKLVDVSQTLNSSLSLREILPNICQQLAHILDVNLAAVYELDSEANRLQAIACFERSIWRFGQGPALQLRRLPKARQMIKNNQPFWMTGADTNLAEAAYLEMMGARALMMMPIYSHDRFLGVLSAFFLDTSIDMPRPDVIQSIRNLALEGLMNVLGQDGRSRAHNVFRTLDHINQALDADWCNLASLVNNGEDLSIHAQVGNGVWFEPPYRYIDLSDCPDLPEIIQSQTLINACSTGSDLTVAGQVLLKATSGQSILSLPLIQRGLAQGLILAADTEYSRVFSKRETNMGRAMIGQAATALENAHLVRDLEFSLQELKDTQDLLVQTARLSAMGELAAVVAHQINNPLTTIVVDTELLMLDVSENSPSYETMLAISRAGKRAASVAKRLLAIARPNDPDAVPEPINVLDTVEDVLALVKNHIERDGIRVIPRLPETPVPYVRAIQGQLDDVWLNLLLNAHDALVGQENAMIIIEVMYNPQIQMIEVLVRDNGPGIPENIRKKIFTPFFTTKPVGEGTGLGLHICRQVIEQAGGDIWVESETNKGTRFTIRLPVMA